MSVLHVALVAVSVLHLALVGVVVGAGGDFLSLPFVSSYFLLFPLIFSYLFYFL